MKVGLIKQRYTSQGGGSERYTNGLIAQLLARGHQVHVFTARWDSKAAESGVSLLRVPVIPGPSFVRIWSFALNCRRAVERADCDLVLSIERTIQQDICRAGGGCHREWLIQRRRYRTGFGRDLFWLNPLHLVLLWIEKRSYSPLNTRAIIANSHRGREEIIRHYHFPTERIHVVHNGTECDRFKPAAARTDRGETVLLFAGSGFERKGLEFVVRALVRLPASVRLEVAGKGSPSRYQRLAEELGVEGRLRFLGAAGRMEEVYNRSDILVHPAIYEPFSNTCLEAMACGLPVITSRINGASEIVRPGENGQVVDDPA
ncbi:MAG: glycosyltransferase family 4 protein, partial [Verrucomicrobia bacterium]|nr:glycosyltransferase family 4 protein [Verrucomicrobiota bacterium]